MGTIEEACRLYGISVDEFLTWERDIEQFGVPGLRTTRYQIYRSSKLRRRPRRTVSVGLGPSAGGQQGSADRVREEEIER